jgi:ribosomal protein S18 acetylase RimI-like enzyme
VSAAASGTLSIAPLAAADIEPLRALAHAIWHAHYPGIISREQIDYMLAQRYSPEVIAAELARPDCWWRLARLGGEPVAFASCALDTAPRAMKLDKLYVLPERQRGGIGGALLEQVLGIARQTGCERLWLAVNKNNAGAIAAYRRHGFAIRASVVKDIGGGFVMDDYIMERPVSDVR